MNCGRAPTTLAIFTDRESGRAAYNDIRVSGSSPCLRRTKASARFPQRSPLRGLSRHRFPGILRSSMCRFSNSLFGLKPLCAAVPSERSVRVAIIGLGYVGLPLAAAVAATGANVVGLDIDAERVNTVNAGQSPLRGREPGLAALVKGQVSKGRLRASLDPSAASGADVIAASARKALAFYRRFVNAEIHLTDWTTAEVVKTAENAYWDVQLAFANEVALISEELGVDAYRVRDLVNTCPYRMMLIPGAGVGGHCIPKDPWLLVSPAVQSKPELIPTAREVNDFMPRRMARLVEEALAASGRKVKGARVAVLGFAYRENTDDTRNSPAKTMIQELRRRGADITIHDPFARSERGYAVLRDMKAVTKGADCVAIATAHDAYRKIDLKALRRRMRHAAFVDGRNVYAGPEVVKLGFVYRGIGKGQF
ncbi:MAG: nucleotide sugar dehydrogenase [Methanobacteriota archaeon]|nr:MAG: nucleotide sugar dehydrogenase [Euryarchaeota archaeon]